MPAVILAFCLVNLHCGLRGSNPLLTTAGTIGLCHVMLGAARSSRKGAVAAGENSEEAMELMLSRGQACAMLREPLVSDLGTELFRRALESLRQNMALIPQGDVLLSSGGEPPVGVRVEPFFLDRFPVTNRQYYEFVTAGAYRQPNWWDKAIWPAVATLLDSTGLPGPRGWAGGRFGPHEDDLPVVGVTWHEAAAYARWLGKRLPSEAEWARAATGTEGRFPWGDSIDPTRANLAGAGPNRLVPVYDFADGVSANGVYQLIGNVWQWTDGTFPAYGPAPMKTVRGGAFDTELQVLSAGLPQSGENPLVGRPNVGFRCAVSVGELALTAAAPVREARA
jgi:iron(II)-dependent oxidoreductase